MTSSAANDRLTPIQAAVSEIAAMTGAGDSRGEFVSGCLTLMRRRGFDRARCWELANDVVVDMPVLVLTDEDPVAPRPRTGLTVPFTTSLISRRSTGLDPAVGRPGDPDIPEIADELGLHDRCWVEVPLTAGDDIVGVLACDWQGNGELDRDDLLALRTVGALMGAQLAREPMHLVSRFRTDWGDSGERSVEEITTSAADRIAKVLDAAVVAVFAFRWPEQRLEKVHEDYADGLRGRVAELGRIEEEYAAGDCLTGRAWKDPRFRHVVDFVSVVRAEETLVGERSRRWHTAMLGGITSVLYAHVGAHDRRYLIRFITGPRHRALPFLSETAALEALLREVRSDVDTAVAVQRSDALHEIASLASVDADPQELLARIHSALRAESVENFGAICHQESAAQISFHGFRGSRMTGVAPNVRGDWRDDSLYAAAVETDGIFRLADHTPGSPLARSLSGADFRAVMTFGIHTGQTRGATFFPLEAIPPRTGRRRFEYPEHCDFGTVSLLHAYSQLIGHAVESRTSRAKVDGARRALGVIGHELRGPLATLNSEAELAINVARRTLLAVEGDGARQGPRFREIQAHLRRMWESQRQVSVALELAPLIAKESEGSLQLHFERTWLPDLLSTAIDDVERELREERHRRLVYFDVGRSARRPEQIVCDPVFMRHVFKNVLRNAVKYSLPRHRGQPMQVRILVERQESFIGVKISNWGWGIPEDQRELIFAPWVRGNILDRRKAIGGMGLGLFLVRRILGAHQGRVLLRSEPTLDDPKALAELRGYETEFELRLRRELPLGTYTHRWRSLDQ